MIAPALEELSDELGDRVTIVKLNIDENPEAPTKYGVRGIPTMILFKDGAAGRDQGRRRAEEPHPGLARRRRSKRFRRLSEHARSFAAMCRPVGRAR